MRLTQAVLKVSYILLGLCYQYYPLSQLRQVWQDHFKKDYALICEATKNSLSTPLKYFIHIHHRGMEA